MRTSITGYKTVGKTKDAGWQVGVSRTVPVQRSQVWIFLLGPGLPLWLGVDQLGSVGSHYESGRAAGEVRSLSENARVRVTLGRCRSTGSSWCPQIGHREGPIPWAVGPLSLPDVIRSPKGHRRGLVRAWSG